jgi:hypothetical protein
VAPCTAVLMPPIVSNSSTVSSMLWPAPLTLSRSCCAASMLARQHATRSRSRVERGRYTEAGEKANNSRPNEPQITAQRSRVDWAILSYLILSIGQSKQRAGSGPSQSVRSAKWASRSARGSAGAPTDASSKRPASSEGDRRAEEGRLHNPLGEQPCVAQLASSSSR